MLMARRVALALATLLLCVRVANSQENPALNVDRDRVLGFDMRKMAIGPFHSDVTGHPTGVVWSQPVITPLKVDRIRVHVLISQPHTHGDWRLIFKDLSGIAKDTIDHDSARAKLSDTWSNDIDGSGATVELSTDSSLSNLEITIDAYAFPVQPTYPQAIWGTDDRRPISGVSDTIQQWGRPVARLRIMMIQGEALCTGFLLSDDLLLTNQHCIKNQSEALSTTADFGYDDTGDSPDSYKTNPLSDHNLELTNASGSGLDYALVRLLGNPGHKYGHAVLSLPGQQFALPVSTSLVVIEHAGGRPKQVSIKDCEVSDSEVVGIEQNQKTDFGHHCDTLGGASGSPVFDFGTGKVVGLHHMGFKANTTVIENQGIYITLILKDIQGQSQSIYNEIMTQTH